MASLQPYFPFPIEEPHYSYANNLKPLESSSCIRVTNRYFHEVAERRRLLSEHPERCYRAANSTLPAQWEVVDLLVHQLAETYPEYFRLKKQGDFWTFCNRILDEVTQFAFGDETTLPKQPLDWIGRQMQEDLILMTQRDGDLYLEAGQLCFPSVWSLTFDFGMSFEEIHQPVPWNRELGEKIRRFLLRVETGKPWTRLNWSMQVGSRLDIPPETFDEWGPARYQLTKGMVGKEVHLRVEEQCILRLPGSNALLFTIHTYLSPMEELCSNHESAQRLHNVLDTLPDSVTEYKGLTAYKGKAISYLESRL